MESLGQAARRLLGRLERAAKAKEIERRLDFQFSRFATVSNDQRRQPPTRGESTETDREPEGTPTRIGMRRAANDNIKHHAALRV